MTDKQLAELKVMIAEAVSILTAAIVSRTAGDLELAAEMAVKFTNDAREAAR
jgi:hypothetical protein